MENITLYAKKAELPAVPATYKVYSSRHKRTLLKEGETKNLNLAFVNHKDGPTFTIYAGTIIVWSEAPPKHLDIPKSKIVAFIIELIKAEVKRSERTRREILHSISLDTGLSLAWLESLFRSSAPSPAIDKIEKLYEHLTGREIIL